MECEICGKELINKSAMKLVWGGLDEDGFYESSDPVYVCDDCFPMNWGILFREAKTHGL